MNNNEFPRFTKEGRYFVTIELVMHEETRERVLDEALADAIYNAGGEVINVGEYRKGEKLT